MVYASSFPSFMFDISYAPIKTKKEGNNAFFAIESIGGNNAFFATESIAPSPLMKV